MRQLRQLGEGQVGEHRLRAHVAVAVVVRDRDFLAERQVGSSCGPVSLSLRGLAAAMISPDTRSSGEMVIDALTRTQPAASGITSSSIAIGQQAAGDCEQ